MFRYYWRKYRLYPVQNRISTPIRTLVSSSLFVRIPPSSAPREAPTPLVFVTASEWDQSSTTEMATLSSMLAEKGFTSLQVDLTAHPDAKHRTPSDKIQAFSEELRSVVRLSGSPFPPVIVARSASCLISQQYIESYPAKAMALISPPNTNADLERTKLGEPFDEFTYEPKFPIAVIDTKERVTELKAKNRLCKDPSSSVDIITVSKTEGQPLLNALELWLDDMGI
ncbi:hypothetical protein FA15DRAFT_751618 [Coprinopsis marcescibilis]|uniref:AB hydrolase-1 domain-containing protein n=1 Tax=Coprinopsis marcescibilis TaxID=230819 RepID=A0A5C3LCV2_COPMA|nr:hypothetical protein FA15DRAFT_751618 [Coprinopsis marcescibilis]